MNVRAMGIYHLVLLDKNSIPLPPLSIFGADVADVRCEVAGVL